MPGWIARLCGNFLAEVLTQADELAAAERICAATMSPSRDVGDAWTWRPAPQTRRPCRKLQTVRGVGYRFTAPP